MRASSLRIDAHVNVLDVGARDAERNEIFRLARGRAGMAADAARLVEHLRPLRLMPVRRRCRLLSHQISSLA